MLIIKEEKTLYLSSLAKSQRAAYVTLAARDYPTSLNSLLTVIFF